MPSPSRRAKLKVLIHSASNLPVADEKGLSDPYVVGFVADAPEPIFETQVCRQTLDPVWDEEHVVSYKPGDELILKVMDKDDTLKDISERLMAFRGLGNDFLGEVRLAPDEFYPHGFEGEMMLEGTQGRTAFLRLRVIADVPKPEAFTPPALHAAHHEPEVNETFDSRDFELERPPQEEATPKPRSNERSEQRGGSSPSRRPREAKTSVGQACRLSITVLSAQGLNTRPCYATCEVSGAQRFLSKTAVVDSSEPVWRKKMDFDYEALEPVVFGVYRKEVWPQQDTLLGTAVLEPDMCEGSFETQLPLDCHEDAFLSIEVSATRRVARRQQPHQRSLEASATRKEPISRANKTSLTSGTPSGDTPKRLRVLIQSFRGLHGLELSKRRCFSCICAIAGRRHADLQTGGAFEAGYQTVWNLEGAIHDYLPGEDLDFHVACEGSPLEGSATMRCHQFFPFGFNSELTMSSDGHGIIGLLRVKISVEKEARATGLHTLGHMERHSQGERLGDELYLRSLRPWDARESSLKVAVKDRHRLNQSADSVIRRAPAYSPVPQAGVSRPSSPHSVATRVSGSISPLRAATLASPRTLRRYTEVPHHVSAAVRQVVTYPPVTMVSHPVLSQSHAVTYPPVVSHQNVIGQPGPASYSPMVSPPMVSQSPMVSHSPMVTPPSVSHSPMVSPPMVIHSPLLSQSPMMGNPLASHALSQHVDSFQPIPLTTTASVAPFQSGPCSDEGANAGALSLLAEARASLRAGHFTVF